MPISREEIQKRAYAFSARWANESSEKQESQSFWNEFFNVFGLDRRDVGAKFEHPVRLFGGKPKPIDLLWPGILMVEHKSKKKTNFTLDGAIKQAEGYLPGLQAKDKPHYILTCDFAHFRLYDLQDMKEKPQEVALAEFHTKIHLFDFMLGEVSEKLIEEVRVNTKAAELMGDLYAALEASGYGGPPLESLIIRAMFCMFADHTGIFDEQRQFTNYVEHSEEDGSNLGVNLNEFFRILNLKDRTMKLPPLLETLPFVNGGLFKEKFDPPTFDKEMRSLLIRCCHHDWSGVSPAIFGTMFQSVTKSEERRNLGAHYTSETNIRKVINSLFLDDLKAEADACGNNKRALTDLLVKISKLKFLDPACGCGNFLALTYRELRKLDTEIRVRIKTLTVGAGQAVFDAQSMRESMKDAINVDNFYGIEIEEFPCEVARAALWLMDHLSNREYSSEVLGEPYKRLPLEKTAVIAHENALRLDWNSVIPAGQVSYVLGNPPFVGQTYRTDEQNEDMTLVFSSVPNKSRRYNSLDYVSAWYVKASQYIQGTGVRAAFVSTKSITQGEQVGPLWNILLNTYHVKILFAHQTFKWTNEAKGKAAVHCIVIGFSLSEVRRPVIFDYETVDSEPHRIEVRHINPYLVDAPDILLYARSKPLCEGVPEGRCGNKPVDDGNYLFSESEKDAFLAIEPDAAKFMRPWVGSTEFINGVHRYCLWVGEATPVELHQLPEVRKRVEAVRIFRLKSSSGGTRKSADTPRRFFFENMPTSAFVIIPETSSESRNYIPMGFLTPDYLCSNATHLIPDATLYHFGILTSAMHMAWARRVCGRLKSDYRYSLGIVYNNFPWPKEPSVVQAKRVEECAQDVLDVRKKLLVPGTSLAHLYDPDAMPRELVQAHQKLDQAVDRCYRSVPFKTEGGRIRFLFSLYLQYAPPVTPLESYRYDGTKDE